MLDGDAEQAPPAAAPTACAAGAHSRRRSGSTGVHQEAEECLTVAVPAASHLTGQNKKALRSRAQELGIPEFLASTRGIEGRAVRSVGLVCRHVLTRVASQHNIYYL